MRKCCECGEWIRPGDVYERVAGKWDGKMDAFSTCRPCAEIRDAFACDGYVHTDVWENIREGMFETMSTGCLEKLTTAAAKEKLLKEWREWKFDQ